MKAIAVDEVFVALADHTRRQLLERLGENGQASASALANELPISRQAIAKHMQVLVDAGLVSKCRQGKEVAFNVEPQQLAVTGRWLERLAARWEAPRPQTS